MTSGRQSRSRVQSGGGPSARRSDRPGGRCFWFTHEKHSTSRFLDARESSPTGAVRHDRARRRSVPTLWSRNPRETPDLVPRTSHPAARECVPGPSPSSRARVRTSRRHPGRRQPEPARHHRLRVRAGHRTRLRRRRRLRPGRRHPRRPDRPVCSSDCSLALVVPVLRNDCGQVRRGRRRHRAPPAAQVPRPFCPDRFRAMDRLPGLSDLAVDPPAERARSDFGSGPATSREGTSGPV